MKVPARETGAALLSVLLLVAVMATIAATAMDKLSLATRLAANAGTVGQARNWLGVAELLAATKIEDLLAADQSKTTLAGGWMDTERTMALPDGGIVRARVQDGGNCFNLNSLVDKTSDGRLISRPTGVKQFTALMMLLGIGEGDAVRIASSASDYIDSDSFPLNAGSEDSGQALSANQMMADASELRLVPGVSDAHFGIVRRWVCALPTTDLSPINVNTLLPEQAPLVAMLSPGKLSPAGARAALVGRPVSGFSNASQFWQSQALGGAQPQLDAMDQLQVKSAFFVLQARVQTSTAEVNETALIDARARPARIVRRSWAEAD